MASNPLDGFTSPKRGGLQLTPDEWADRGNAILAELGRSDVHWFVHEGQAVIGHRLNAPLRLASNRG